MKAYSTLLSLAGAAIFLAGGLAYLLNPDEMWLVLVNVGLGLAAPVEAQLLVRPRLRRVRQCSQRV